MKKKEKNDYYYLYIPDKNRQNNGGRYSRRNVHFV